MTKLSLQLCHRFHFDGCKLVDCQVERRALRLQVDQPFPDAGNQSLHLLLMLGIGIVEIEKLLDFLDGEAKAFAAQNQLYASDLTPGICPGTAYPLRGDKPLLFVEA